MCDKWILIVVGTLCICFHQNIYLKSRWNWHRLHLWPFTRCGYNSSVCTTGVPLGQFFSFLQACNENSNDMQLVDSKIHYLRIGVSYEGQTCFATHYGPFRSFLD